ncbi:hypothetical protein CJ030_MR7G011423 [Morella rubra]|uniref:Transmembrane protein 53 n=1 Tax=Morella rubra TaxID=262757 RepID=A0A6A1V306_9ROSI|nr:hypothetical protein CJ030_MR7G011423 [Morella rubra]
MRWGGGGLWGDIYWGRKEEKEFRGIAVIFAWASIEERHLKSHVDLYASLGWNCLVCHADFLNAMRRFYPERAISLAFAVLNELAEELKIRLCPIVFVAFSGGPKACMYKIFQVIDGTCGEMYLGKYQLVRNCISGQIYDSSPVDFTSDLGARFTLHPSVWKLPGSSKLVSWVTKGIASGLDALYLTRFDSQRVEYWQALYSSVNLGAPFLIICSEKDELAPYQIISNFVQRLLELGGDVKLVKLNGSFHIGHYKHYPIQYRAAVTNMLDKAASIHSQKMRLLRERSGMECMHDEISELICDLQKAAVNSNESLRRVAVGPSDHFFLPSSAEYHSGRDSTSLQDEQKERSICLPKPSSINAHSVLGQILFDVCVPENVEGWDIKFGGSVNGQPFASARRHSPFHGIKCIRRSRL